MSETDKIVSSMLEDAKAAFLRQDMKELSRCCQMLAEFTRELSTLQNEKLIWYRNQSEDLQ